MHKQPQYTVRQMLVANISEVASCKHQQNLQAPANHKQL